MDKTEQLLVKFEKAFSDYLLNASFNQELYDEYQAAREALLKHYGEHNISVVANQVGCVGPVVIKNGLHVG